VFADVENSKNIGMVQRGNGAGLLFETMQADVIASKRFREDLHGDIASKTRVAGAIYFAHAACTERGKNFVWACLRTRR
jgi:hypothetical protein